jgi:signal transduction histidine kinase
MNHASTARPAPGHDASASEPDFAEMVSLIAHELRSPLTAVQGFSGTLLKRWEKFSDEQRRELVGTVYADALRMGRIITEVLDLARLETGRLVLQREEVNVAAIAERAVERVTALPGTERVSIDIDGDLTAWADAARLEGILATLVENAVKFSDDGAIEVRALSTGAGVEIEVVDRGIGIERERLSSLFSGPAPSVQRSAPQGTGLGLYLAKRVLDAHGGSISVVSEPRAGSKFTVTLPPQDAQ